MEKVKVTYTIRDNKGFLVDHTATFPSIPAAIRFVRSKQQTVGKPIIEAA